MHVSVTLTASSQVRLDDEATPAAQGTVAIDEAAPSARVSTPPDASTSSGEASDDQPPSEDPTEEGPLREGLYGPMHWLDDSRITALLSPYICEGWDTGDFARFADLAGPDARRLRTLLPPLAREDRQNNAPRLTQLLRAATRIDGLTLEGYVIRAPRWDERVSVDTVCVPESAIVAHTGRPVDDEAFPTFQHWLTLAEVLGVGADAVPPDEMRIVLRDSSSTRWWWAWWD